MYTTQDFRKVSLSSKSYYNSNCESKGAENQHVILAEIHDGSEILYRTPHAVLATPMIRNAGVLDAYRILSAAGNAAAEARHVDLILLCPWARER